MQKKNKSVGKPLETASSGFSTAQLTALIESTNDLIWAVDLDYRLISFNRALQQNILNTYGVRLEVGMLFHEVLPPERAARWPGFYERVLAEGPFRIEYFRVDGGIMELAFNPIVVDGKTTGISMFGKEITEQKKSENALKKTEANLSALIESTHDLVWSVDLDNHLTQFNRAFEQAFLESFGIQVARGMSREGLLPPEKAAIFPPLYKRALSEGPFHVDYTLRDGRILELSFNPILVDGKATGVSVFGKDITERKKALDELREREARLKEAERLGHFGSFRWDVDSDTNTWSEGLYYITGTDPATPPPRYAERVKYYTPESWARMDAAVKRALATGEPYDLDVQLVRSDGALRWARARGTAERNDAGRVYRLFGTLQDITEQKLIELQLSESEERYRATFEQADVGIVHASFDGRILRCNKHYADILGYSIEEITSLTFQQVTAPEDRAAAMARLQQMANGTFLPSTWEKRNVRKDGSYTWVKITDSLQCDADGHPLHVIAMVEDINDRKAAEERLAAAQEMQQASEERYRTIFETSPDAILLTRKSDGTIIDANQAFFDSAGYERSEVIGRTTKELNIWVNESDWQRYIDEMTRNNMCRNLEVLSRRKDGKIFWMRVSSSLIEIGGIQCRLAIAQDISEAKTAEEHLALAMEALQRSEARYRMAFQTHIDAINITRLDNGTIVDCNQSFLDIVGFKREEVIGRTTLELGVWTHALDRQAMVEMLQRDSSFRGFEFQFRKKSGGVFWGEMSASVMEIDGIPCVLSITRDLSAAKAAEEALHNAEQKYREIFEDAPEGIFLTAGGGGLVTVNPAGVKLLGYESFEEMRSLIGNSAYNVWNDTADRLRGTAIVEEQGIVRGFQCPFKRKDGTLIWVSITARALHGQDGKTLFYQGFFEDISEQKRLESALKTELRENKLLSEINAALLRAKTEEELLSEYCRIIVETGGYRMAWVGFAENTPDKPIVPVAHYGHEDGYLKTLNVTWADTKRGQGPTGRAIRSGTVEVTEDIAADPLLTLWRAEALNRGYRSSIALPFRYSDGSMACLSAYGETSIVWSESERKLMQQIALDLGYGITTLRTEIIKKQYMENLKVSLEETIQVIADTVDQRDPFTAGHQRRVADLCIGIAKKIGLTENRTHGLRLAAIIHDLGKIAIPAELLSKPGRLRTLEFNLIKEHPRLGYDIIKHIDFPWPIADIILQHHERLDGSGYPQGLKADEILLESRILAVADEVEAMSSHRPYRPSKGIDESIDSIIARRGTHLDLEVVDACAQLFREDGYNFPD
jgi:PAS domain S-box-containing protein